MGASGRTHMSPLPKSPKSRTELHLRGFLPSDQSDSGRHQHPDRTRIGSADMKAFFFFSPEVLTEGGVDMSPKRSKWLMFYELGHTTRWRGGRRGRKKREKSGDTSAPEKTPES